MKAVPPERYTAQGGFTQADGTAFISSLPQPPSGGNPLFRELPAGNRSDLYRQTYFQLQTQQGQGEPQGGPYQFADTARPTGDGGLEFEPVRAKENLLKRLDLYQGLPDNVSILRYYTEDTEFVANTIMKGPIAYDPAADVIRYNPHVPFPPNVNPDGVLIHELAHRADKLFFNASANLRWQTEVQHATEIAEARRAEIESWFVPGGLYYYDAFFSDIIDALMRGTIAVPYGHGAKYWNRPLSRENEIFANMTAIDIMNSAAKQEFTGVLKGLYEIYKTIQQGGEINGQ